MNKDIIIRGEWEPTSELYNIYWRNMETYIRTIQHILEKYGTNIRTIQHILDEYENIHKNSKTDIGGVWDHTLEQPILEELWNLHENYTSHPGGGVEPT